MQSCSAASVSATLLLMSNGAVASQSPSKAKIFFRRLITTVILWTVIIAALFFSNPIISDGVFVCIIVLLSAAGLMEFYGLAEKRGLPCFKWCGLFGGVLLVAGTFFNLTGHLGSFRSGSRNCLLARLAR